MGTLCYITYPKGEIGTDTRVHYFAHQSMNLMKLSSERIWMKKYMIGRVTWLTSFLILVIDVA